MSGSDAFESVVTRRRLVFRQGDGGIAQGQDQRLVTPSGIIRGDGLMEHEMYVMQVNTPAESKHPLDYYKLVDTMSGDQAFGKLSESK